MLRENKQRCLTYINHFFIEHAAVHVQYGRSNQVGLWHSLDLYENIVRSSLLKDSDALLFKTRIL